MNKVDICVFSTGKHLPTPHFLPQANPRPETSRAKIPEDTSFSPPAELFSRDQSSENSCRHLILSSSGIFVREPFSKPQRRVNQKNGLDSCRWGDAKCSRHVTAIFPLRGGRGAKTVSNVAKAEDLTREKLSHMKTVFTLMGVTTSAFCHDPHGQHKSVLSCFSREKSSRCEEKKRR